MTKSMTTSMMKLLKQILLSVFVLYTQSTLAGFFISPRGEKISLRFAVSSSEQTKGLSGLKSHEFNENEGMLFVYDKSGPRRFWMPDTYFNLDIYFLDANYKILAAEKNVPFHPGRQEPPLIYQTKTYNAQYVLEMKSSSPISKILKVGEVFKKNN